MHPDDLLKSFREKARKLQKCIVLPEGTEPRTIKAASIVTKEKIAKVILVGNPQTVSKIAEEQKVDIKNIEIIDPVKSNRFDEFVNTFFEIRKKKGISQDDARKTMQDPVYFGTMMVQLGAADGLVSGAEHSTADTIRPALQIIKTSPGISIVSSIFIMIVPDCKLGENGLFIFADCAVNPNPTAEELAAIAVSSAETGRILCNIHPRVAMLSFSTMGSAEHEMVNKVRKATALAREIAPNLDIDGELQVDAAIVPEVGKKKAPKSKIAGVANVLVFPDLQAGNAGYKLVERLAKAAAIGPFLQGLNKPVNDLSRGCSVDDIVNVITITAVQGTKAS
jgi:phosphate acetyltransferase